MDYTYEGWAQLRPLDNEDTSAVLVSFLFRLNDENRYKLSSRNAVDVSLMIPEIESEDAAICLPIEAILMVNKKGEVFVERPVGPNVTISIDGGIPIDEGGSTRPLPFGCTVSFGARQYLFQRSKGMFDDESLTKTSEINRCHVCKQSRHNLFILHCGHSICIVCRREGIAQPPIARYANRPNRTEVHQAPGPADPAAIMGLVNANIQLPMHCSACRTRITAGVASSSIVSLTANQAAKAIGELNDVNERRPMCENCGNNRGLIGSRDYNLCQDCNQMSCAPCILQWHRNHKLKSRIERLRDLDEVDQKLNAVQCALIAVERLHKEAIHDKGNQKILHMKGRQPADAMNESMRSLSQKVVQCRQQAADIQERKRALAYGLDEPSRTLIAEFDRSVQEARGLKQYIDGVRNHEVSLSFDSSSEESLIVESSTAAPSSATFTPTAASTNN